MIPPQREYERVPTDDFVNAQIREVEYDEFHEFTFKGQKEVHFAIRFVLAIAGLQNDKKTRWFKFNYDERSNVYRLFVAPLVQDAQPYMEFDLDQLKGVNVKMLWKDDKDPRYQSIDNIRIIGKKIVPNIAQKKQDAIPSQVDDQEPPPEEEVPF